LTGSVHLRPPSGNPAARFRSFCASAVAHAGEPSAETRSDGHQQEPSDPTSRVTMIGPAGSPKIENLTGQTRLASILIEGAQWATDTVSAQMTVACPICYGFAVQRGRIVMNPSPGRLTAAGEREWSTTRVYQTDAYGRPGQVNVTYGCCTAYDPFWDVSGVDRPIGKFSTDPDFTIERLAPGDEVTVAFGSWLSDMQDASEVDGSPSQDAAMLPDGFAPVNPDRQEPPMEDPKRFKRLLSRLIRQTGLPAAADGYVELSRCTLKIGRVVVADRRD
jgi:hypothetical protein